MKIIKLVNNTVPLLKTKKIYTKSIIDKIQRASVCVMYVWQFNRIKKLFYLLSRDVIFRNKKNIM